MRDADRKHFTLTNRLLTLAALIVLATTFLLLASVASGVYSMAQRQHAAREVAYRDMLLAEIDGRLREANRVVSSTAAEEDLTDYDVSVIRRVLSTVSIDHADDIRGMALITIDGELVAEWPSDISAGGAGRLAAVETSGVDVPLLWEEGVPPESGALWAIAPVKDAAAGECVLCARLRTEPVEASARDVARSTGTLTAVVIDSAGRPLIVGGTASILEDADYQFTADAGTADKGRVIVPAAELSGYYADVTIAPDLGWRVAVLGRVEEARDAIWLALRPSTVAILASLLLALAAALIVVNRVTRPIKELEYHAQALALGSPPARHTDSPYREVDRLLEAFDSIGRKLGGLSTTAELLARSADRPLVYEGLTNSVVEELPGVDVDVLELSGRERLRLVAAQGRVSGREGWLGRLSDLSWVRMAVVSGEQVSASSGRGDALRALHGNHKALAFATPLWAGEDIIGAVVVVRRDGEPFTEEETEAVRRLAVQASTALYNSQLFDDERMARREAEVLREIAESIAAVGDLEQSLRHVADIAGGLLGYEKAFVALQNRELYGLPESAIHDSWVKLWHGTAEPGRQVPLFLDLRHVPVESIPPDAVDASAALLVPLARQGISAGVVALLSPGPREEPGEHAMDLATTIGKQASLALHNAYLNEQARRRATNLETIFRISHAVGSSLQTRVVLNRVLDVVQKILAADAVMLMTYDPERKLMTVPMARGVMHRSMLDITFGPGEDVPGRVFETREPERFDHISTADTRLLNAAAGQGLESLLAVPLLARGRSIGVLSVFSRSVAAFTSEDLDLLRTFASQAALAIDTAEMFSREHHVAEVLRDSIVPSSLARIPGIESGSIYMPAGPEAEIGGDYYDLFEVASGRVVISIGDVCGKGVEAATKTSMLKYAIRGMTGAGLDPAPALEQLNAMLMEIGDESSIVTVWLGVLDVAEGSLLYANGGHPPGLLLDPATGRIRRLETTGALLGAVNHGSWAQERLRVTPGSTLLLYTDGVTDARFGRRFFGEGRVRRALRGGGSAREVATRLLEAVERFSSGTLRDDAAILAVSYHPPPSRE